MCGQCTTAWYASDAAWQVVSGGCACCFWSGAITHPLTRRCCAPYLAPHPRSPSWQASQSADVINDGPRVGSLLGVGPQQQQQPDEDSVSNKEVPGLEAAQHLQECSTCARHSTIASANRLDSWPSTCRSHPPGPYPLDQLADDGRAHIQPLLIREGLNGVRQADHLRREVVGVGAEGLPGTLQAAAPTMSQLGCLQRGGICNRCGGPQKGGQLAVATDRTSLQAKGTWLAAPNCMYWHSHDIQQI